MYTKMVGGSPSQSAIALLLGLFDGIQAAMRTCIFKHRVPRSQGSLLQL